jgi:1-deoxy-D-xylulose 5-phosphate reductoisomerase
MKHWQSTIAIYPIDSEHSAIFQCLQGNRPEQVKRLIITASGGSFRTKEQGRTKECHSRTGTGTSKLDNGGKDHHRQC